MTNQELRDAFFKFYGERGHVQIGQAPLVPERDTSVLFTTAGMHPLIPYLLGDAHPAGTRLMNIQRSLRTTDVDEVSDATHLTVFEMLGHWSLGDYWKQDAINWSYQFVTQVLKFPKEKLAATIFGGDDVRGVPLDEEAKAAWQALGMERIAELADDNFWGPVHSTGPCGPTTEIFVHVSPESCGTDCLPGSETDKHWVEIWNNVFMGYQKTEAGTYEPLAQKNIDTGVGLERVLMTVNNLSSVYETDLLQPTVQAVSPINDHTNPDVRLVVDHIRAAVFMIADGVEPANKDRGYVLRRLIRRVVRAARTIEFSDWALAIESVVGSYADMYPHLEERRAHITSIFLAEQQKFESQLTRGQTFLEHAYKKDPSQDLAVLAFLAFQSHALPGEISYEILKELAGNLDHAQWSADFESQMNKHRDVSKIGSEKKFGGHGLILDNGEMKAVDEVELKKVTRLHTATHLLQAALRAVLGDHVHQKGSDITAERLRFDFTHGEKLTDEQKQQVTEWVNNAVQKDVPVHHVVLPLAEAKATGALHFAHVQYPPEAKVYYMGNSLDDAISIEFCGGPHVQHTGEVGTFKILKEESVSAGTRRIKADVE